MNRDSKPKIICLGLGRTGTASLRYALELLGYGPSYHTATMMEGRVEDFPMWFKITDGNATSEEIRSFLQNYGSMMDYPAAVNGPELYAAYPEAKYILTTRDPAKWEKSVKATIMMMMRALREVPTRSPACEGLMHWTETYVENKHHRGRLYTHTQQELLDHNDCIKQLIPPEKLLIYEVGEGWERLVEFLGVPMPTVPFPHVNDTAQFQGYIQYIKDYAMENPGR